MKRSNFLHMQRVALLPCACCGASPPSCVHHIRSGEAAGLSQRASDFLTIPLCPECHQGDAGLHGSKALLRIHKTDEYKMLAKTIEKLEAGND
jgi:hypothetical protein